MNSANKEPTTARAGNQRSSMNDLPQNDLKQIEIIGLRRALRSIVEAVIEYDKRYKQTVRIEQISRYSRMVALAKQLKERFEL